MQSEGSRTAYAYERAMQKKRQCNVYSFSTLYLPEEAPVIMATFFPGISVILVSRLCCVRRSDAEPGRPN